MKKYLALAVVVLMSGCYGPTEVRLKSKEEISIEKREAELKRRNKLCDLKFREECLKDREARLKRIEMNRKSSAGTNVSAPTSSYSGTSTPLYTPPTYTPVEESRPAAKTSNFVKPVSMPYSKENGWSRTGATQWIRPNAYGPGISADQYGRPVKTVPAN